MALGEEKLRSILESLLMITPEPVPVGRLVEVIQIEDPQTDEDAVRAAIQAMVASYQDPKRPLARGFRVDEVAGGLQFRTTPENAPYVRRFLAAKPSRLSKPALETLAIIAYRQPVTKPEVEAIRGVDVGAALKNLLDRDFVRILGKKDEVGRPIIYGTTELFLEFFGLRSLAELPTLREYHDLDEEHQKELDALGGQQSVRDLANAAQFMVEVEADPDLDALEQAVHHADDVRRAAELALDPNRRQAAKAAPQEASGDADAAEASAPTSGPKADEATPGASEIADAADSTPAVPSDAADESEAADESDIDAESEAADASDIDAESEAAEESDTDAESEAAEESDTDAAAGVEFSTSDESDASALEGADQSTAAEADIATAAEAEISTAAEADITTAAEADNEAPAGDDPPPQG